MTTRRVKAPASSSSRIVGNVDVGVADTGRRQSHQGLVVAGLRRWTSHNAYFPIFQSRGLHEQEPIVPSVTFRIVVRTGRQNRPGPESVGSLAVSSLASDAASTVIEPCPCAARSSVCIPTSRHRDRLGWKNAVCRTISLDLVQGILRVSWQNRDRRPFRRLASQKSLGRSRGGLHPRGWGRPGGPAHPPHD